jgi:hypothetical protein
MLVKKVFCLSTARFYAEMNDLHHIGHGPVHPDRPR